MLASIDQQLEIIERNNKGWRSISHYDRSLLQQLGTCLQACSTVTSDDEFLDMVFTRRTRAFDLFEYVAAHMIKHWHYQQRSLGVEQLDYLTLVGTFNRRLALTLQNDYDDDEKAPTTYNIEHQIRVRELLLGDNELFDLLIGILPTISENETNFIRMIIPWYEALIHFEHSNIDVTLDEKFNRFNANIVRCLKSNEYNRSLIIADKDQTMITSVRHRFYLGTCTMAMGIHINCEQDESDEAKQLLESYLTRYRLFIHSFVSKSHDNSSDTIHCLTGIVSYLVNYTLMIDNDDNRQLFVDLFAIVLDEQFYSNLCRDWSTNETILLDSIIGYLIIYCFQSRTIIVELLRHNDAARRYIKSLEKLVEIAQARANHRMSLMSQMFILILSSCTQNQKFSDLTVQNCLNSIQIAFERHHSYHYNRIPINMFLKSLINVVKYDSVQEMIRNQFLPIFIRIIINIEQCDRKNDFIYQECVMIVFNILWSLSFNEKIKKKLNKDQNGLIGIIQRMNVSCSDSAIKQSTCGLLYNLNRLDVSHIPMINGHNFGKTIGISHDLSDFKTVNMIETELNKVGHRVWTTYDHMDDHFIPSFVTCMHSTQYLIVCLSDMYRLNNRCRAELLYATSHGHAVISWKVRPSTQNPDDDEIIRIRGIKALLDRISLNEIEHDNPPSIDKSDVKIEIEDPYGISNSYRRRRLGELMNLENWSKSEVNTWSQSLNSPGFSKLLSVYDGQSLVKLYEFSKQNSTETLALLNRDLHAVCNEENLSQIQISVHEFIHFQIELEKLLSSSATLLRSPSMTQYDINTKQPKIQICTIL